MSSWSQKLLLALGWVYCVGGRGAWVVVVVRLALGSAVQYLFTIVNIAAFNV